LESNNDVIVYALKKIIAYARRTQQIFVAQCVWWLVLIIGLEPGLVIYIDNLQSRLPKVPQEGNMPSQDKAETSSSKETSGLVHPDRIHQITVPREVLSTPRDLTEDRRLDRILDSTSRVLEESIEARDTWERNRVYPLPQTRTQLKKARKNKHLQEAGKKREAERNQRLQEIRDKVIQNLSKE
jgi:hypothetical protein